jgi:Lrp/AsnC family leucine-responsive transcriptional regulator
MDKIDREILRVLVDDGRCAYSELAERVHLSGNAVAERVRRMVGNGTILGFRAILDPAAFGRTLAAQIDVKLRPTTSAVEFEKAIRELPQVTSATLMTGSYDYAVRVECVDRAELVEVTETIRNQAGALETYSRVILREVSVRTVG